MSWQALLLETHILGRAVDGLLFPQPARKSLAVRVMTGLAIAFACAGLFALSAGAYIWLAEAYSVRTALLATGGGGLLLALLIGAGAWAAGNYRFLGLRARERLVRRRMKDLGTAVLDEFGDSVREHPKTAAAIAALAGLALGEQVMRDDIPKDRPKDRGDKNRRHLH